jgi:hypothetical protein
MISGERWKFQITASNKYRNKERQYSFREAPGLKRLREETIRWFRQSPAIYGEDGEASPNPNVLIMTRGIEESNIRLTPYSQHIEH